MSKKFKNLIAYYYLRKVTKRIRLIQSFPRNFPHRLWKDRFERSALGNDFQALKDVFTIRWFLRNGVCLINVKFSYNILDICEIDGRTRTPSRGWTSFWTCIHSTKLFESRQYLNWTLSKRAETVKFEDRNSSDVPNFKYIHVHIHM